MRLDVVLERERPRHHRAVVLGEALEQHRVGRVDAALVAGLVLELDAVAGRVLPVGDDPEVVLVRVPGGEVAVAAGDAAAELGVAVDLERAGEIEGREPVVLVDGVVRVRSSANCL